jgi:hypothetical protein
LPNLIPNQPLDKIFGGIPARLAGFPHASVRHYDLSLSPIENIFSARYDFIVRKET